MSNEPDIHELADVQTPQIGSGTRIWQYCVILPKAKIGKDCNICSHCFIENDVVIGDSVTIKSGVQLWDGMRVEDDVFIGPNVTFTNDKFPRSKQWLEDYPLTTIRRGASIGANATVLPGVVIGPGAMVGAGSVVTMDVPANATVFGNPAQIRGYAGAEVAETTGTAPADKDQPIAVKDAALISLNHVPDLRGTLCAVEEGNGLPFEPKRFFFVYDVPSRRVRGEHAHRVCHQFLISVRGSVTVMLDDAETRSEIVLDRPTVGLWIPPGVWAAQFRYSADTVLLVAASDPYDPDDYIRDYDDFLAWKASGGQ